MGIVSTNISKGRPNARRSYVHNGMRRPAEFPASTRIHGAQLFAVAVRARAMHVGAPAVAAASHRRPGTGHVGVNVNANAAVKLGGVGDLRSFATGVAELFAVSLAIAIRRRIAARPSSDAMADAVRATACPSDTLPCLAARLRAAELAAEFAAAAAASAAPPTAAAPAVTATVATPRLGTGELAPLPTGVSLVSTALAKANAPAHGAPRLRGPRFAADPAQQHVAATGCWREIRRRQSCRCPRCSAHRCLRISHRPQRRDEPAPWHWCGRRSFTDAEAAPVAAQGAPGWCVFGPGHWCRQHRGRLEHCNVLRPHFARARLQRGRIHRCSRCWLEPGATRFQLEARGGARRYSLCRASGSRCFASLRSRVRRHGCCAEPGLVRAGGPHKGRPSRHAPAPSSRKRPRCHPCMCGPWSSHPHPRRAP
mmetsp:Transcript_67688/g.196011  ORF Transcript_67688/g.196011 Transcript_67688/m.196011 type:complete len:425 (+) Transcript_67688:113-1387(+)